MCAKIMLFLCPLLSAFACSASTYDQRQTGDLNVQVDLKDLRIIALMKDKKEEYVDYDYAYDYNEMTIKPQNGTTPKPLNNSSSTVATVNDQAESSNNTVASSIADQTTSIKTNSSENAATTDTASWSQVNDSVTTVKTAEPVTDTIDAQETMVTSNKNGTIGGSNCKKGLVVNQKGECELKLQSAGNALLKLVKLSQKLKLRREDRNDGF